jgi:hypothetical protein
MSLIMVGSSRVWADVGGEEEAGENLSRITAAIGSATVPARFSYGYQSGSPDIEIPDDPVTSATSNVTNQTQLEAAIAAGGARTINMAAGDYGYINLFNINRDDLDFVMDDATFVDGINIGSINYTDTIRRVRFTGGNIGTAGIYINRQSSGVISDLMFDNVNNTGGTLPVRNPDHPTRLAFINCNLRPEVSEYGLSGSVTHFILANCDLLGISSGYSPLRVVGQYMIIANNRFEANGHRVFRLHISSGGPDTLRTLFTGNQMEGPDNQWVGFIESGNPYAIRETEFHGNSYYNSNSGTSGGVMQTDADVNGGIDDFIYNDNDHYSPDSSMDTTGITNYSASGNTYQANTTPPAYSGGADH